MSPRSLLEHFAHDAEGTIVEGARLDVVVKDDDGDDISALTGGLLLESIELMETSQ
jgi:hypothetical protein